MVSLLTFSDFLMECFFSPVYHHGRVTFGSNGLFQAASPTALEEHHIPQEKQGAHSCSSKLRVKVDFIK